MYYPREEERGENPLEDHFCPGYFEVLLEPGEVKEFSFCASIEDLSPVYCHSGPDLLEKERERLNRLLDASGLPDDFSRRLALSADSFIVRRRSTGAKSIIAGYHWFNDWGRDTMIALPGLTLATGRYADAREILKTFARYCREGLIPNMFPDAMGEPLYNSVDASLWFFNAVHKYLQYTGDTAFVLKEIYPVLKDIAGWYIKGTRFNIKMDEDGLILAGAPEMQLTWMDAKVDGWVVTPRQGKPVEISALWYNALVILEGLASVAGEAFPHRGLSQKIKKSFEEKFWCREGGYLYDVIDGEKADAGFRPNQVIALALPHSPVDPQRAGIILGRVWQELYATYGLRSLSYYDPAYRGVYGGDRLSRDGAYHQGTAWSWLMGPFITAYRKAHRYSAASRKQAEYFISPFKDHLASHGLGHISEIFDGNDPVVPRGCIAQAWGTAELLRAYVEDVLEAKGHS
jgi:predicted glycogen debranching enzyme